MSTMLVSVLPLSEMHKGKFKQAISDFACLIFYDAELLQTSQMLLQKNLLFLNQ
jgi:hypothetical protein